MILLLLAEILERGVYSVKFPDECNINSQIAREIIKDIIRNTNVDDFAYVSKNEFIMIVDVLSKRKGPVEKSQVEQILKNYCDNFQIDYKHPIP
ncbi:MAG: hypothetical protein ABIL49_06475 [candidate division WOR-3 bacterium]